MKTKRFTPLEKYQSNVFLTRFIQKITVLGIAAVFFAGALAPMSGYGAGEPELLWERRYDSLSDDIVYDVTVDNFNNIIVTGMSNKNYYTIKYDLISGNPLWEKLYDSGFTDAASGVVVDSKNNIIVTGAGGLFNNNNSLYRTIKYDSNGSQLWTDIFGLGENSSASDIGVDSSDNVVITGYFLNYSFSRGYHSDILTLKYDASGRRLWHKIYDKGRDTAYGVAIDSKDNVIVTGVSDWDFFTIKYDASGNELWSKTFDNGSDDSGFSVAVDSLDNIIVAGSSHILADNKDYTFLIKYDSNGRELWKRNYEDASWNKTLSVAVDSLNNIIVARVRRFNGNYNYYTIAYDPAGNILWEKIYDGGSIDMAVGGGVDSMDNVIVTGRSYNGQNYDYLTLKYGYPAVSSPLASFTTSPSPAQGDAPLSVNFTDTSTNNPTSWSWDFDNNGSIDSTLQNPTHTYTTAGDYTVSLSVSNQAGTNTKTMPNLIRVTAPDTAAPVVSIIEPLDNAAVKDTIIIKVIATDNRGVNRVEFYIDNILHFADNTSPYEYSWNTRTIPDGARSLKARAYDEAGNSVEDNIAVRVNNVPVNHPPVLNLIGNRIIDEGQELRFTISATDPDGDTLSYSAGNLPSGAAFLAQTFSWTPDNNQAGIYPNIHFEVSDSRLKDSEDITITVNDVIPPANHPPVANAGQDQLVESGALVTLDGSASLDPDNDSLSYQWTQTSGIPVSLQDASQAIANLIAPEVTRQENLEFQLTVKDPGSLSAADITTISVKPRPITQPTIQITNPPDNSLIPPHSQITISANLKDPDKLIKKVSFLINNKTYGARKNRQGTYYYPWRVPYGYSQTYTIQAQAQDKQGKIIDQDQITVLTNPAPAISIISPQDNQIIRAKEKITIQAQYSPNNNGITKTELIIINQTTNQQIKKQTDLSSPYQLNWTVPGKALPNTTYLIQAKGYSRDTTNREILIGQDEVRVRVE